MFERKVITRWSSIAEETVEEASILRVTVLLFSKPVKIKAAHRVKPDDASHERRYFYSAITPTLSDD